jgi:hypothetical protein
MDSITRGLMLIFQFCMSVRPCFCTCPIELFRGTFLFRSVSTLVTEDSDVDHFLNFVIASKTVACEMFYLGRCQYRGNVPPIAHHSHLSPTQRPTTAHPVPVRGVPQAGNRWRAANIRNWSWLQIKLRALLLCTRKLTSFVKRDICITKERTVQKWESKSKLIYLCWEFWCPHASEEACENWCHVYMKSDWYSKVDIFTIIFKCTNPLSVKWHSLDGE